MLEVGLVRNTLCMSYSNLSSCFLFYLSQFSFNPFHFSHRNPNQEQIHFLTFEIWQFFLKIHQNGLFHVLHCFRAFYEAKTRGEFEKKETPAEKPAYWNNSPKHSESEQGANPFLEMKKDVKKQKEVQVNFVDKPLVLKIWILAPQKICVLCH